MISEVVASITDLKKISYVLKNVFRRPNVFTSGVASIRINVVPKR